MFCAPKAWLQQVKPNTTLSNGSQMKTIDKQQQNEQRDCLDTDHQPPPNKKQKMQQSPNDRYAERKKQAHPKVNPIQEKMLQSMDRSTRVNVASLRTNKKYNHTAR